MQLWQREVEEEAERMGNELERDDERQKREAQRDGPRAMALPLHTHIHVTSPCCKLGCTCSLEMSEHISQWLASICIGALLTVFI